MILLGSVLLISLCVSIPMSVSGINRKTCSLEENNSPHYWYVSISIIGLLVSDFTAYAIANEISKISPTNEED